jgi:hypothetical protein
MLASLQELARYGFIETDDDTINTVCKQDASKTLDQRERGEERQRKRQRHTTCAYEEDFLNFWEQYPLKVGRKAALKAYQARRRNGTTHQDIMDGLSRYLEYKAAAQERHHNPATFLGPNEWYREPWTVTEAMTTPEANGRKEDEPILDEKFKGDWKPAIQERKPKEGNGRGNVQIELPGGTP